MKLLNDSQMQDFIVNGYVTVKADHPPGFHESVYAQAEDIFSGRGNPGNDILPAIPQLADLFAHPAVAGALTSVLGPGYAMHPHRHCHLTPPRTPAQRHHQDSYEDDQNVRHHRTRWAMAFYYPQDVSVEMGPTAVLPASQYYTSRAEAERKAEALLCGDAGTVTIVHYDLWHRAAANHSDRNRYMIKFLFCRMAEPAAPSWRRAGGAWRDATRAQGARMRPAHGELPRLRQSVWDWHLGNEAADHAGFPAVGTEAGSPEKEGDAAEAGRLENAYWLSRQGRRGLELLLDMLAEEAGTMLDHNLAARHTNPSQLISGFGLSALGAAAVPHLLDMLRSEPWPLRAAAADVLGDIGLPAVSAVPRLLDRLDDGSEWVRRNAVEALGNLASPAAVPRLARLLRDDNCHFVRHNAALSLAKTGRHAAGAEPALRSALDDENLYVRGNARLAMERIGAA